jgi:quinol monooxygenase YgiN
MTSDTRTHPARRVIIRYTVKPEHIEQNEQLVRAVYDELARARPSGLRYATFRLGAGGEFMHLSFTETADGRSPLTRLATFQAFQEGIAERCEQPPVVTELHEVGSFGWFDAD